MSENNLSDLNDHLFSILEKLNNDEEMQDSEELNRTMTRARAACSISTQILNVARVQLQAIKTAEDCGLLNTQMPALVATKDSVEAVENHNQNKRKLLGEKL